MTFNKTYKSGRAGIFRFLTVPALVFVLVSCTDIFSTTLAPWARRDPAGVIPPVTADNVDELIGRTENDPDYALALLEKIREAEASASAADKSRLQAAALETASNAAGLGQSILGTLEELTSIDTGDLDAVKDLVVGAINDMKNLEGAASLLVDIVPDPSAFPDDFDSMTAGASVEDLALAAVVLISSEAKSQLSTYDNFSDYIDDIKNKDPTESENLAKALALAAIVSEREDELSSSMRDVLAGLNLVDQLPVVPPAQDPVEP